MDLSCFNTIHVLELYERLKITIEDQIPLEGGEFQEDNIIATSKLLLNRLNVSSMQSPYIYKAIYAYGPPKKRIDSRKRLSTKSY